MYNVSIQITDYCAELTIVSFAWSLTCASILWQNVLPPSLFMQCLWFWHRNKENVKLTSALHGNTRLLGLHDNQFTWQHGAKNIWTALNITGEREKRGLPSHTYLCGPQDGATALRQDQRCVWGKGRLSQTVCIRARHIHAVESEISIQTGRRDIRFVILRC